MANTTLSIRKDAMQRNGQISVMPSFGPEQFQGIIKGRKSNYPSVVTKADEKSAPIRTTFCLTDYAEAFPNQTAPNATNPDLLDVTFPEKMRAEEGDRYPTPITE